MASDAVKTPRIWDFAVAPPHTAPGVPSMVGYRALDVPDTVHRGLPSSTLTFIVSLDEGVEAADTADRLSATRPNPVVLGGLHVQASHVRQRRGQAGVQVALHPLASRAASVAAVAQQVGLSQRHLTTLFRREVGRTPKVVAMLMRFEYATARMADAARGHRHVDLAGIALDAGYADQAHLTREFVRFVGVPPGVWLGEEFQNIQDGGHPARSQWCHDNFESDSLADPASA